METQNAKTVPPGMEKIPKIVIPYKDHSTLKRVAGVIAWPFAHDLYKDVKKLISRSDKSSISTNKPLSVEEFERLNPTGYKNVDYEIVKLPWYKRKGVKTATKWSAMIGWRIAMLAAGYGSFLAKNYVDENHRKIESQLSGQRNNLESFVNSEEFDRYQRGFNDRLVLALNYAFNHPKEASASLPKIAEYEKAHSLVPWTSELTPLDKKGAGIDKEQTLKAAMKIAMLLSQRGYFDESGKRVETRRTIDGALAREVYGHLNYAHNVDEYNISKGKPVSEKEIAAHKTQAQTWKGFERVLSDDYMARTLTSALAHKYGPQFSAGQIQSAWIAYNSLIGPALESNKSNSPKPAFDFKTEDYRK